MKTKVIVFVDGSNMFYLQKKLGWLFDWNKINKYLDKKYQIVTRNFYEPYKDSLDSKKKFFDYLKKINFTIITKPVKIIIDPLTGKELPKANFDVEITRDVLLEILYKKSSFENFVLLSGDSDFAYLVKDLKHLFKKKIIVFAGRKNLSWELRTSADEVFYFEDIKSEVFRKEWGLTKVKLSGKINSSYRRGSKRSALFLSKKHVKKS